MTLHTLLELSQEMMERFLDDIYQGDVSEFSAHKGLFYHLIYNLVRGRIHSLSAVDYRIFTGTTKTVKAKYEWPARRTTQARFSKDPSAGGGEAAFQRKKPGTADMDKGSEALQLRAREFSRSLPLN